MAIPFRRDEPEVQIREMPTMVGWISSPAVIEELLDGSAPLLSANGRCTDRDSQIRSVKHAPTQRLSFICRKIL